MLTEEQKKDTAYCKAMIVEEIAQAVENSNKLRDHLIKEVIVSIVYLKIFSAYLQEKKFESLEEAWKFMCDLKGIWEKVSYVNNYLARKQESISAKK